MSANPDATEQSSDTPESVNDVFSGKLTVRQALQKLRASLLDLTARNPLLNFRHSKSRTLQFAGTPDLDGVFGRLIDNKTLRTEYVPNLTLVATRGGLQMLRRMRGR